VASTILVVEDDDAIRAALVDLLEDEGYDVRQARDGAEALTLLRSEPPPCLILLDWMMPVMDGKAFLEERERDPSLFHIPVVVLTAGAARPTPGLATVQVLAKPIRIEEFLDVVASAC
jgi:CheY-like chemotaxis protein